MQSKFYSFLLRVYAMQLDVRPFVQPDGQLVASCEQTFSCWPTNLSNMFNSCNATVNQPVEMMHLVNTPSAKNNNSRKKFR